MVYIVTSSSIDDDSIINGIFSSKELAEIFIESYTQEVSGIFGQGPFTRERDCFWAGRVTMCGRDIVEIESWELDK